MFIQRKNYLSKLARVRVSEGRDLDLGLRLDRNEKVDVWPKQMMADIFLTKPDWFLSVYPESTKVYQKLAQLHGVDESEIMLTSGIDGGLKALYEIMTEPGDLLGVVSPTYAMYHVYAKMFQLQLEEILYTEDLKFGMDQFDAFLEKRPTMFFLPNPNQPIESCFNVSQLEEFARRMLAKNCLFVIDEAYHMFGAESAVALMRKYENVVIARTFSKGFGVPSIRLGYFISNRDNMNVLAKTRFAHESNSLSNAVAEYLLDNYAMVESYNAKVVAARGDLKKILGQMGIPANGDFGNFLLLDMQNNERAHAYVNYLREQKIYIKGPWSGHYARFVTITLGPYEVMERFLDATKKFLN
ncbi:MAG: histidinol-phosphate aminotransferase family protein [Magnetococcales bacterium]|nr:histidinol-phosphate aminotransferase family protein [Magnetococcales bacterium]